MARSKTTKSPTPKRRPKVIDVYTEVVIQVGSYDAAVDAAINHVVYAPQNAFKLDDSDPVFAFKTRLVVRGVSTYPPERASDQYEFTIYGDDAPSQDIHTTLKDVQKREGGYGLPQYREYRGRQIPIYEPPSGLGLIEKIRGQKQWSVWVHAPTRFTNDLLTLLGHKRPLFIYLRERKNDRARWVQGISLQTVNPLDE